MTESADRGFFSPENSLKQDSAWTLASTPHGLCLQHASGSVSPIYAELDNADIQRRISGGRKQPLARACGLHKKKSGHNTHILDATGGLGRDAATLAGLGCRVTLYERNPVIAALLQDGLERWQTAYPDRIGQLQLINEDFTQSGHSEIVNADIIYLDPMYPETGSALSKKEMQALQDIVGHDHDIGALFNAARRTAALKGVRRIVVKRPAKMAALTGHGITKPSLHFGGARTRYDIYLL